MSFTRVQLLQRPETPKHLLCDEVASSSFHDAFEKSYHPYLALEDRLRSPWLGKTDLQNAFWIVSLGLSIELTC